MEMIMKGGPYRIQIRVKDKDLFYTSEDIKITETHIFFKDRDNKDFVHKISSLVSVNEVRGIKHET